MIFGSIRLSKSLKLFGPVYATGTMGTWELPAIVTAPLFNGTSSLVLVPLGKIPTTFPSFRSLRGTFIVLGPGFSLSTGNAFRFFISHFRKQIGRASCRERVMILVDEAL